MPAHFRCLVCDIKTGDIATHTREDHAPQWEHCRCGDRANPRKCLIHPWAYNLDCQGSSLDSAMDDVDELVVRVEKLEKLVEALLNK